MLRELKEGLGKSVNRMKGQYDKHRREEEFQPGDWVYLKLRPYRQQTISQKAIYKLGSRFYGPFQIEQRIGTVAYKLSLPSDAQIHPVMHVSQLRRRLGTGEVAAGPLPIVNQGGRLFTNQGGRWSIGRLRKLGDSDGKFQLSGNHYPFPMLPGKD